MNRETEISLPYGSHLENGMKVLIGSPDDRHDLSEYEEEFEDESRRSDILESILKKNRWCVVKHLQIGHERIKFVGVYDDGVEFLREYPNYLGWIVKKNTMPRPKSRKRRIDISVDNKEGKMDKPTDIETTGLDYELSDLTKNKAQQDQSTEPESITDAGVEAMTTGAFAFSPDYGTPAWVRRVREQWEKEKGTPAP
jgi:hypothetical protein